MALKDKSTEYLKGYSAGSAYVSNIRKFYSSKLDRMEDERDRLKERVKILTKLLRDKIS